MSRTSTVLYVALFSQTMLQGARPVIDFVSAKLLGRHGALERR